MQEKNNIINIVVVFLAAGLSNRFQEDKMFYNVGGKPLIVKSLENYIQFDDRISSILIVSKSNEDNEKISKLVNEYFPLNKKKIYFTQGGISRSESTLNALNYMQNNEISSDYIAITDGARCYVTNELLERLISSLSMFDNAIPAIRRAETFKIIENGFIKRTLKNNYLYEIQTPQIFKTDKIIEAYKKGFYRKKWSPDDSAIYFSYFENEKINIVKGDVGNIKVTFKEDIKNNEI